MPTDVNVIADLRTDSAVVELFLSLLYDVIADPPDAPGDSDHVATNELLACTEYTRCALAVVVGAVIMTVTDVPVPTVSVYVAVKCSPSWISACGADATRRAPVVLSTLALDICHAAPS